MCVCVCVINNSVLLLENVSGDSLFRCAANVCISKMYVILYYVLYSIIALDKMAMLRKLSKLSHL